uniref:CCHC-type domain-containing protein n=1 Tax=Oryctolagus cuniculus TaxID=9986 RepID=A0A5F9CXA2_RABIT
MPTAPRPPPFNPLYSAKPVSSPVGITQSGAPFQLTGESLYPLREVVSRTGTIRVHVSFTLSDFAVCKEKMGKFSEDPSRFTDEFQAITLAYDLNWNDIHLILTTCCMAEEKLCIWIEAQRHAHEMSVQYSDNFVVAALAVPHDAPEWCHQKGELSSQLRDYMVACLLAGMRRCGVKSVDYEKIKEVVQGPNENPAMFQGQLVEAVRRYTNIDPESPEGWVYLSTYFVSQSTSDIRKKLQELAMGSQTPISQLLEVAFQVFNNRIKAEERVPQHGEQAGPQAHQMAMAEPYSPQPRGQPRGSPVQTGRCYRCGRQGHLRKDCLLPRPPPRACSQCNEIGHWRKNCPLLRRERGSTAPLMASSEQ